MKTKSLLRYAKLFVTFIMVFLWTSATVNAQCPTISDPAPPPICDASSFNFADLNSYAIDNGNGIVWYDVATGGVPFGTSQLVAEGTYYADDNSGTCGARASIIIDFQVNSAPIGASLDKFYCSNENATIQDYIDDALTSYIPTGVEIYYDSDLTNQANVVDNVSSGVVTYYIVFINGVCKSQINIGTTIVSTSPTDPTPSSPQVFCSDTNPTIADLNPGTTGSYSWYDNIDGTGNPIPPVLLSTTALVNGETYYVIVDEIICDSNAVPVTVTIDDPNEPGLPASLEYCDDSLPATDFNLFDELGGTPDTIGTWSGPLATTNGHLGTVNISILTAGTHVFVYTIPSNGACPESTASVTITVFETFTSGTQSGANPASFCESGLPASFDLFTLIEGYDIGGQWTQGTLSTDPVVTSSINLTNLIPGTHDFTYTQNVLPNPCPEEFTTVQVVVLADPNSGNAVNQVFCENDLVANSPFNLFDALDGSQDNNSGTWTDSSSNLVSSPIDITSLTVSGSPYTFNYTIDNGTCLDTEPITITIEPAPESGTPIATFPEFCEGVAPSSFDLFDLLDNEDQTGTWYIGVDNTGSATTNPVDLSVLTPATYDFTFDVDAIGSCDDVLVTVSVTINPLPNTGIPSSPTFCENDLIANSPLDLFGQLTGEDAGGTWTDDDTTGTLTGSSVDLTGLTIGSFSFTYSITDINGCTNSSTVVITVENAPESGTPVATFPEFCEGEGSVSFDLFDLLDNEDQTGTWNDDDASGALTGNTVDLSVLTPATYNFTFDVDAIGSCDDVNVTVSITINPLPNTGIPTSPTFCENDLAANSPLDLFAQLAGEDGGGTWTDDDATGTLTGSTVDLTGLTIGTYNFTYTITDVNSCTSSSTVVITVEDAPESGTPNTPVEFCLIDVTTSQTFDLFDLLTNEDQTGTWNDDDATGALSGNTVTLDGLAAGTYDFTFDVDAIGSCDDVNVTVSIIINDTSAPIAATPQEFCDTATVAELVATGTTIQWYDVTTGGTPLADTAALVDGQTYYATQTDAITGCESSIRTAVDVTIYQSPNAGNPNAIAILACNDDNNIDLFTGLDGTQDVGGTWSDDDATGALTGNIFDATGVTSGTYSFTYTVTASAPCVDDSTTITVTIDEPLNAGTDNVLDVCSNNGTTDLFTLLGSADTGGTWSPALASGTGVFDPLVDVDGTYTYTLTNGCGTYTSEVVVTVTVAPFAGTDNSTLICVIDGITDLFPILGTGAQTGGTWSPALASGTGEFDPNVDTAGIYTYTVAAVSPCSPDATAEITVTVDDSSAPGVNNPNPEFCLVDNPTVADLDGALTITGTVTWYEDAALTTLATSTDSLVDGEDYYATQTNTSGCESSTSVTVTVTINDTPTPTLIDSNLELCINDDPTVNELTLNIAEYDSSLNNVVWYDAATNGNTIGNSMLIALLSSSTLYAVLVDQVTGCESSVRLAVTPDITSCGELIFPDGFSPNGDGVNDTYDIDNLDVLFPNFEMEIYNRNGNIVYKGNASTSRFDGTSNQSRVVSKGDLPVGVYFYIFNYNDGVNKPEQGRLYLNR